MRQLPRGAPTRRSESAFRDRILIALTDKATILRVVEATHGASGWASSAHSSSQRELNEGLELIDAERARLDGRLHQERTRRKRIGPGVALAASEAECERILCRLRELADHREHLAGLLARMKSDVEVESVEWQRPLALSDGEVVGFVDLWATLRVTSYRISQGNDPTDHEHRTRYEGYSVHHLIRSIALFVEPAIRSLSGLVRQVRYAQAHAKNALPVVVTCLPVAPELLASQGIPTYVWSPDGAPFPASTTTAVATRRIRRVTSVRRPPAPTAPAPQLPSPRPSLPPAPLG